VQARIVVRVLLGSVAHYMFGEHGAFASNGNVEVGYAPRNEELLGDA
jgi:hypothetical protein